MLLKKLTLGILVSAMVVKAQATVVTGAGFQQRGFHLEQTGKTTLALLPQGGASEVVVIGPRQILGVALDKTLAATLDKGFLSAGILRGVPANFSGYVDAYVIAQENGKNPKLIVAPTDVRPQLPEDYSLRSESLGFLEIKNGSFLPFSDLGEGIYFYSYPMNDEAFREVGATLNLTHVLPENMTAAKIEFRLRLPRALSKPEWVALQDKEGVEVARFFISGSAKSGQVISVIKSIPVMREENNNFELKVVNSGLSLSDFKFRIREIKTVRKYSAR